MNRVYLQIYVTSLTFQQKSGRKAEKYTFKVQILPIFHFCLLLKACLNNLKIKGLG